MKTKSVRGPKKHVRPKHQKPIIKSVPEIQKTGHPKKDPQKHARPKNVIPYTPKSVHPEYHLPETALNARSCKLKAMISSK